MQWYLAEIKQHTAWISNYIPTFMLDMIIYPCPECNSRKKNCTKSIVCIIYIVYYYMYITGSTYWTGLECICLTTSNGSWCMGIKGEMSGTVCVTFTWHMYIYIWVVYSFCLFCCLFIVVTWWYVWCIERASGNQEEVQACLVTLCLFIISSYSVYKTTV